MRRPLTSPLPSYTSSNRLDPQITSAQDTSADMYTPRWFRRWWFLLYVILGCYTITVISSFMIGYFSTPSSLELQQNEILGQHEVLIDPKVVEEATQINSGNSEEPVHDAMTNIEALSVQEHNREGVTTTNVPNDVRSGATASENALADVIVKPNDPPTAKLKAMKTLASPSKTISNKNVENPIRQNDVLVVVDEMEEKRTERSKISIDMTGSNGGTLRSPHKAEAEMHPSLEHVKSESLDGRDTFKAPVLLAAPMSDKTRPLVHRSVAFSKALSLARHPETKAPNPNFKVYPLTEKLPGDDNLLIAGLRNNTADRNSWSSVEYREEVDRLESLKKEANDEILRIKELIGAVDIVLSEEKDRFEEKRVAETLDIRLHQPRKIRNRLKCMGWRQTGQCISNGQREPKSDLECTQITQGGVSGYCEVLDEETGELFRVMQLNCSSVRNHVVFSCAEAADFANFGLAAQKIYLDALAQNASDSSQLLGNHGNGNGIVMVVYPKLMSSVYASISVLRSYNCTLPIELWISRPEVIRTPSMKIALELLQQRFLDVTVETITDPTIAGFSTKIHAVHHSKFENVVFLDADNIPVRDPTFLFESQEFLNYGAIFWPDFWHPERTIFNIQSESLLWQLVDLPFVDMFEQESGQLVINRKRAAIALEVLLFFANHRPSHFSKLMLAHGDKDLFRLAWMKAKTQFYMIPFPPASAGPERGTYRKKFCGMTMVQFDAGGNILFLHRNSKKLDAKVDKLDPQIWTHLQSFTWEKNFTSDGDDIQDTANKSAVQRMMSYEDIKQKYRIGVTNSMPLFKEVEHCYGAEPDVVGNFNVVEFKELPFATLEQQLIDYAHDGALLMGQARNRMGN
ncbi:putative alpha-mannosyltransferase, nucleotide-diphospho-sugar transferase [Plasmopara halstedii]